jgi:hypothetical protein
MLVIFRQYPRKHLRGVDVLRTEPQASMTEGRGTLGSGFPAWVMGTNSPAHGTDNSR